MHSSFCSSSFLGRMIVRVCFITVVLLLLLSSSPTAVSAFVVQRRGGGPFLSTTTVSLEPNGSNNEAPGVGWASSDNNSIDRIPVDTFSKALKVLDDYSDSDTTQQGTTMKVEKAVAQLPIQYAGQISLADCGSLVIVNDVTPEAAQASGLKKLDTITRIGAQEFAGEVLFGEVDQADFDTVVKVYTQAINYCRANGFDTVKLGVQRLVKVQQQQSDDDDDSDDSDDEYQP